MTTYHPQSYYHHYNSSHEHRNSNRYISPSYEPREYYPKRRESQALHMNKPIQNDKFYKHRKSNTCCDSLCCGCFVCCPKPCRWFTCILFLFLIGFIAAAAVLIALFKKPSVNFTEIKGTPSFNFKGSNATVGFNLEFTVDNPNFESMTFKSIDSVIYYDSYNSAIGYGHLENIYIAPNAVSNITYPITLSVDVLKPEQEKMFTKLMSQCGIGSEKPQNIKLKYEIIATASILGIGLPIPYNSHVSFQCPMSDQTHVLNELNTIIKSPKASSALPKAFSILSALPTAIDDLPIPTGFDLNSIISGLYPVPSSIIV